MESTLIRQGRTQGPIIPACRQVSLVSKMYLLCVMGSRDLPVSRKEKGFE
jgi:hypothetical protein